MTNQPKRGRRRLIVLAVVVALLGAGYWWFLLESHLPDGKYTVDLREVRALANSVPGPKPVAIHFERCGLFRFPTVAVLAGEGWSGTDLVVYAYQLEYPEKRYGIVDTAMSREVAEAGHATSFEAEPFARVSAALPGAEFIVVTHEHFDHIGGLGAHPAAPRLLVSNAKLTHEQANNPEKMDPLVIPAGVLAAAKTIDYSQYFALAPGVVLIKAPGHTLGSQLVFVQKQDGTEYLFLGDVAWHTENVEWVRERARLVTALFIGEDRDAVMLQLAELNRLAKAEPKLHLVPGHDSRVIDKLAADHLLESGFVPPSAPAK